MGSGSACSPGLGGLLGGFKHPSTLRVRKGLDGLLALDAVEGGAGVHCHAGTGTINTSIIAFSDAGYGVGATEGYAPTIYCCDVYGNPAGEYDAVVGNQTGSNFNISEDPLMCGYEVANYWLYDTSPCHIDHSPCGEQIGYYGQGCDSPVEKTSWGRVKALWR